ncbi:MAG: hypothetical protein Q7R72_00020 [bacterium]|nr:hypothetical protein [bacterium]
MIKHGEFGSTLTEVVVVTAILSVVSLVFLGTFATLSRFHEKDMLAIKGELLAEEGMEAIRLIKSGGWNILSSLPVGSTRYLVLAPSSWSVTMTPEIIDGIFYRSFRVYAVSRDVSDDIVTSGGTVDPNTLRVDVSVGWNWRNATSTANYQSIMTNI